MNSTMAAVKREVPMRSSFGIRAGAFVPPPFSEDGGRISGRWREGWGIRKMQIIARGTEMIVVKKKIQGHPAETRHPPMKRPRICREEEK